MEPEIKKKFVDEMLSNGKLISEDLFDYLGNGGGLDMISNLDSNLVVINKDLIELSKLSCDYDWEEFERCRVMYDKGVPGRYETFLSLVKEEKEVKETATVPKEINIVQNFEDKVVKREIQDFVSYFLCRYRAIEKILKGRQELQSTISISRALGRKEDGNVAVIGIVTQITYTKNNNIVLVIEDPTSTIKAVINKNRPELFNEAKSMVMDEIVGVVGTLRNNVLFATSVLWPDIPFTKEFKKGPDEAYAAFISDVHVGSINFLEEEFLKFIGWLNCEYGNDNQKRIAEKVKYLFIAGDLVDGCGIYPNQDKELNIVDAKKQYERCAELLSMIRKDVNIIVCPGNHDATRIAEPQLAFYIDFAKPLYDLENVTVLSNPCMVNINASEGFPGFDVLMYHGYSFDYYANNVESLRSQGGYSRADLIMKFLLKRRHLAPAHTSSVYIPNKEFDPLVINRVPDFFITGHIHYSIAANYRNISLISCSCWQSKTSFQEKMGHEPQPARVPVVNLQTREIKILRFSK